MPLNLSDTELEIIINAAKPFQPGDRDPLLRALAQELSGYKQIGSVNFGLAKNLQRSFFSTRPISAATAASAVKVSVI
jgi:hypothetical protein